MFLLGPDILKIITAASDLYITLGFLYNAGFCFIPIYIGYAAVKKLNVSLTMPKPKEIQMAASQEIKDFLKDNDIEVITYDEIK